MGKYALNNDPAGSRRDIYLVSAVFLIPLVIIWQVFINNSGTMDKKVFELLGPMISSGLTAFMKAVSFLGKHDFLIPANLTLIAVLLMRKEKDLAWRVAAVALSSLGLMSLLKNLFGRNRPDNPLVEGITNFSFPSGHAFMSVAFYGLLIWLIMHSIKDRRIRLPLIVFLAALILLIGFSRIYLRVHYLTDVIAGLCIGLCWLYFCLYITGRKKGSALRLKDKP